MSRKSDLIGIYEVYKPTLNEMLGASEPGPSTTDIPSAPMQPASVATITIPNREDEEEDHSYCERGIDMSKSQVFNIIKSSNSLLNLLNNAKEIEPWMAAKITLACDYICTVRDSLEYDDFENYCSNSQDDLGDLGSSMVLVSRIKDMLKGEDMHVNEEVIKTAIDNIEKLKN